jgi:hypothetical protein
MEEVVVGEELEVEVTRTTRTSIRRSNGTQTGLITKTPI